MNQKSTPRSYFLDNFVSIIMDEGHNLAYVGQEESLVSVEHSPPPLTTFFSQSRELLMSTVMLTQFPDLLMNAFKNNAGCKLIGNITETENQRKMSSSVGLDREDEKILGKLQKQIWVAMVSGRTKPFVLKTPSTEKFVVGDADVFQRSKPLLTALQMKQTEIEARMFMTQVEKTSDKIHLPELPKEAWLLLDYIFQHEWNYQQQIAEALGLSDRKFAKTKQILIDKRLIRIEKFAVKVHDRIHFALTGNALDVMKTVGKPPQRIGYWKWITGVPGYEHHYWQNVLRVKHRILGWNGRLEYDLKDGRRVDLFEENSNGFRKGIEIELSTKDVENKIRVLTDGEVDELVLLYRDESLLHFAKSKLEKMEGVPKEKIWIGLIRDYVEILDDIIKHAETSGIKRNPEGSIPDSDQDRKSGGNIGEID